MRGQRKNPRKAVQPFENKKRKIDIFKNYEANGVEKIQRKLEIFSTLISKKSSEKKVFFLPQAVSLGIQKCLEDTIRLLKMRFRSQGQEHKETES